MKQAWLAVLFALLLLIQNAALADKGAEFSHEASPAIQVTAAPTMPEEHFPELPRLSDEVLCTYFDDAMLVGDSITRQFHSYTNAFRRNTGLAMNPTIVSVSSYSLYTASRRSTPQGRVPLTYRGRETTMYHVVETVKPGKLFILLGVNDYIGTQIDNGIAYAERIIEYVADLSPDTRVIFISLTPVTRAFCREKDYRTMWDEYNLRLANTCFEHGAGFLNLAPRLKDGEGYLPNDYSSDGQYHLAEPALAIWMDSLFDFAQHEYEAGRWSPAEVE